MAGISKKRYKLKSGKEVIKYVITYRDIFGKQHTTGGFKTEKEAKKELSKFNNVKYDNKDLTFGDIYKIFLKRAKEKYSFSTYNNYKLYYDKYLIKLKDIKYHKINSIVIQNYFDDLVKNSTPYVGQHCLKFSRAAFNYAIKHKMIEYNIFNEVDKIDLPKADINHLTQEEIKQVLEMCKIKYPQYYVLLFTFIGTGAREGEILALNKDDFNPKEGTILINKQFTQGQLVLKTKTESSNRKIFLFEELKNALIEHIKNLDTKNPLLFPNKTGGYIHGGNFRKRIFYKILKKCGINKRVRIHDLRGSYIDMVLASGLSCKFAQNQVGHARTETTLNVYAQNNKDMIENAQDKLNSIFDNSKKCEQFVSQKQKTGECKIFYFPSNPSGVRQ